MSARMRVRLHERIARARGAAAAAGSWVPDWVRAAIRDQLTVSIARGARAGQDAHGPLYSAAQEDALLNARMGCGIAAFDRDGRAAAPPAR